MNFIFLIIDSLRADRLSCYGYHRPTSPFLDSLAKRGVLFENFFTPIVPTHPAVTTIFTGQFPLTHKIFAQDGHHVLREDAPWFPEALVRQGYVTAGVDSLVSERSWFSRGFQSYVNPRKNIQDYHNCFRSNHLAIDWLRSNARHPFFLFVHYFDPHTPYMPPHPYRSLFYSGDPTTNNPGSLDLYYDRWLLKKWFLDRWLNPMAAEWPGAGGRRIEDIEFIRAQYDASIRLVDDGIAQLLEVVERLGMSDDTTVIVAGDHGQELGEHGIFFDQHGLYESNIHPPLLIHWPGTNHQGRTIRNLVQSPDLASTLLEMAGCEVPVNMDGRSLVPLLTGRSTTHVYNDVISAECTWMAKWALRKDGYKLIVARAPDFYGKPQRELYDLSTDPEEQTNLADSSTERCSAMTNYLEEVLRSKLVSHGKRKDPLVAHGITMGRNMARKPDLRKRIKRLFAGMNVLRS